MQDHLALRSLTIWQFPGQTPSLSQWRSFAIALLQIATQPSSPLVILAKVCLDPVTIINPGVAKRQTVARSLLLLYFDVLLRQLKPSATIKCANEAK